MSVLTAHTKQQSRKTLSRTHREFMKKESFFCQICSYKTSSNASLKEHTQSMHEGIRYGCEKCDWTTPRSEKLRLHLAKRQFCSQCDFQSCMKKEMLGHQILHKKQCQQCDYIATQVKNMKIHIQAIHEQITYSCQVCSYKSSTTRYLALHMKSKHPA